MSTTTVEYDPRRYEDLTAERTRLKAKCQSIADKATAEHRDLSMGEESSFKAAMARITEDLDPEIKAQGKAGLPRVRLMPDL